MPESAPPQPPQNPELPPPAPVNGEVARADGLPAIGPDFIEEDYPELIDDIVPTKGYQMTPMIGIGGSAGSIPAMERFFKSITPESGMIFVVILHLSPTHTSSLAEMIGRWTSMKVVQAENGEKVAPNTVYVIPPGKFLATVDGHLRLTELQGDRGKRVAVDLFFRSLADTHGPHAAAIILSGADGDGALGLKRIKERGGLTIAQDPDEAEHRGMPRSAIDTGMVDWVLEASEISGRLVSYFNQEKELKLPPEDGPQPAKPAVPPPDLDEVALRDVLSYLRSRTGRDFSYYKRATIVRRISRRMQVNGVEDVPNYLSFLRMHPGESGALLQDLLISVTNFFRDRDAFEAIELRIPELFKHKGPGDAVRVWVPACATGEEAYSLAMLLLEHARKIEHPPVLQVFACDLDEDAIRKARIGIYPESSVADVSDERLRRFFMKEHTGYRVRRELREMVLFATHDLLKDAPFSRMDLISCRNLMIYLTREAQLRLLDIFHFAMKSHAVLFLGSSESIDENSPLFRVQDKKHRIYVQQPVPRTSLPVPKGPSNILRTLEARQQERNTPVIPSRSFLQGLAMPFRAEKPPGEHRGTIGDLHFKLIEKFSPPSVIVNADHDIVHLSEHAGAFLHFGGGEPTANLLRVVHPMLRIELRAALFRAMDTGQPVEVFGLPVDIGGASSAVDLRVAPAGDIAPGYSLVTFENRPPRPLELPGPRAAEEGMAPESVVHHLEHELDHVKNHLRDTVEQYEASTEELKASNEELQAMNEELRSATEELETSREELQSINEELTTVNQELKGKVDELGHANSDLQNLMASTAIATIFLNRTHHIMRYTPKAVELFHLIPTDLGRPLDDLKHRLDYPELTTDADQVLKSLVPVEREVRDGGRWFQARLQPYRTLEDQIAGVVLTFVDITENKRSAAELLTRNDELERFNRVAVGRELRIVDLKKEINDLLTVQSRDPRYTIINEETKEADPSAPSQQS
ncbi:MAG TPA: CheR family methyltransferase [Chthoniobacteraceae bacterium]|jgi:two-component system CheB/CheR fusion protein|nr:CheR family methyltransferase [Chthoniobacteraceae bacterium]